MIHLPKPRKKTIFAPMMGQKLTAETPMNTRKTLPLLIAALAMCVSSAPAWAEKGGKGHGHGRGKPEAHGHDHGGGGLDADVSVNIRIGGSDRDIIQRYIARDYRSHCPPGLAKKRNGCLPPGQAKKRYAVGKMLPHGIAWDPLPSELLVQLGPVPAGHRYVRIDKDVLLVSEASHKVIDAITLMSAVGQ
jgi:hypothetical protein